MRATQSNSPAPTTVRHVLLSHQETLSGLESMSNWPELRPRAAQVFPQEIRVRPGASPGPPGRPSRGRCDSHGGQAGLHRNIHRLSRGDHPAARVCGSATLGQQFPIIPNYARSNDQPSDCGSAWRTAERGRDPPGPYGGPDHRRTAAKSQTGL